MLEPRTPTLAQRDGGARRIARAWLALFLASFALYAATAQRGAQWQDSGHFILRIINGEVMSSLGLALSHPLHHWLGRLALHVRFLEPSLAITLVSGLAAAAAVANVYGCVRTVTNDRRAALFAGASLALANTFWNLATITESYTLTAALLAGECWCLILFTRESHGHSARDSRPGRPCHARSRRALWGMLFLNGLCLANHLQAALTAPVLAAVVIDALWRRRVHAWDVAVGVGAWVIGSLPYTYLIAAELVGSGDLVGTMKSSLFGASFAGQVLNTHVSPRLLFVSLAFPLLNFPNLLLPAAAWGLIRAGRMGLPATAWAALVAGLVIHAGFVARYSIVDQHFFFLPVYVLLAIFGGIGASLALQRLHGSRQQLVQRVAVVLLGCTPLTYVAACHTARNMDALGSLARNKPYRDDYTYLLIPWGIAETSAERMSRQAVELAGRDGIIVVEDPMGEYAVRYQAERAGLDQRRVMPVRPGRLDEDAVRRVEQAAGKDRAVVFVPVDADRSPTEGVPGPWERRGDLYVLSTLNTRSH